MPDPWTEAWEEAEASAPPGIMIYATLELRHAAFVDGAEAFAIRVVTGIDEDMSFTLEDDAPLNPGEEVEFKAVPFSADKPEFEEGKTPETRIVVDNVAREMTPHLEAAVQLRSDMTATYREYRSDDLSGPCYGPVTFTVKQVKVNGTRVEGMARIDDLANRKFPNKVYTLTEFPGLRP